MAGQKGGIKLRRSGKKKGYYEAQKHRTARNKDRRAAKRIKKAAYWKKRKADEAMGVTSFPHGVSPDGTGIAGH